MTNPYLTRTKTLRDPASEPADITPSNDDDLPNPVRAIFPGVGGDIKVTTHAGKTVTYPNVIGGQWFAVMAVKVFDTGTTATNLIGEEIL